MNSDRSSASADTHRGRSTSSARSRTDASGPTRGTRQSNSVQQVQHQTVKKRQQEVLDELSNQHQPDLTWLGGRVTSLNDLRHEIDGYFDILLGKQPLPIDNGILSLQESATAIYARAKYIRGVLQLAEADGRIAKNGKLHVFRTGPLQNLMDAAFKMAELGSRRVTVWQEELHQDELGRQ